MSKIPPFKLIIGPAVATSSTHRTIDNLTVSNAGAKPIILRGSLQALSKSNGHCAASAASGYEARFTPATFTLLPGQSRHVRAVVTVPASAHGKVQLYLVESGTVPASGHVTVSGATGSLLQVTLPGTAPKAVCVAVSMPPHHNAAATFAGGETIGAGLGALAILTAATVAILRRKRMRYHGARRAAA